LCGAVAAAAEDSSPLSAPIEAVRANEELELLKEEETVSIARRYEQPISQAPSNVYFIIEADIRHSGATDIPTVLRRVPDLNVMLVAGTDFNVTARRETQLSANEVLMTVDGRSVYIDGQGLAL
jgi:iron complex outermembrane receptor protein